MIVPAKKRLAKILNPRGRSESTPRNTMMTMKATKKATMMAVPDFQERFPIFGVDGAETSFAFPSFAEVEETAFESGVVLFLDVGSTLSDVVPVSGDAV